MTRLSEIMTKGLLSAAALAGGCFQQGDACTRIIYHGNDDLIVIGRSLDWKTPIPTNLYVYPRGMEKQGSDKPGAVTWTSKYGAVYAVGYDGGVTEGLNEKGLSVNGLFCKGTVYDNDSTVDRPPMSLAVFTAWLLDMNATTGEVIDVLRKHDFSLTGATFDDDTTSTLHWGVTDASGHTAVIEFDHGDIKIYEGTTDMHAMTNDPSWPQMQAIVNYWQKIGGSNALPGTVSSPDRCVRANYFVTHVEKTGDADLGVSIARTVLFNCCVPYTYTVEGEPNVSSTQWRSFSNLRDLRYYFDVAVANGLYYIDLNKCDFRKGASVMKLVTADLLNACGDQTTMLQPAAPFTPMY